MHTFDFSTAKAQQVTICVRGGSKFVLVDGLPFHSASSGKAVINSLLEMVAEDWVQRMERCVLGARKVDNTN